MSRRNDALKGLLGICVDVMACSQCSPAKIEVSAFCRRLITRTHQVGARIGRRFAELIGRRKSDAFAHRRHTIQPVTCMNTIHAACRACRSCAMK